MVGTEAALGVLYDVALTLDGTTGGDDGNPTRTPVGSPITVLCDKITHRFQRELADHGTAQTEAEFMRIKKLSETLIIETKLQKKTNAALYALLIGTTGIIVRFTITAVGANITGDAMVEERELDYDGPSTIRIVLRNYGVKWTKTAT